LHNSETGSESTWFAQETGSKGGQDSPYIPESVLEGLLQVKTEPNIILGIEEVLSKYLLERG
jgi:hypothetical protein